MKVTIYGIKNCSTMKKAFDWLDANSVAYDFHDYKKAGVDPAKLQAWIAAVGWEKVINRAGPTFRKLPDADKSGLDADKAVAVMVANTSCIKRPVVEHPGGLLVGFNLAEWAAALG